MKSMKILGIFKRRFNKESLVPYQTKLLIAKVKQEEAIAERIRTFRYFGYFIGANALKY